jgi:ribonuclease E
MTTKILIEQTADEVRAALVESERLVQLQIDPTQRAQVVNNIYRGVVRRVDRSLEAAFVDIGAGKDAFLSGRDMPYPVMHAGGKRKSLQQVLKTGQSIVVQATREAAGSKGVAVTAALSLAGRFLVLIPETERGGISRKLGDKERERLRKILDKVELPDGMGLIVRTAGANRTKVELERDFNYLSRLWNQVKELADKGKGPQLLYREGSLPIRFVRDFFRQEVTEIRVNDRRTHEEILSFVRVFSPRQAKMVILDEAPEGLFRKHGVEAQVSQLLERRVPLKSGGFLVFDSTEALVAVDVNSGKVHGKDAEDTVFRANMEAAWELARQIILRDLGGLIVIDFIDMEQHEHVKALEAEVRKAFAHDRARLNFGRISEFGLMEMTRQRLRPEIWRVAAEPCPRCGGTGFVKAPARSAMDLLLKARDALMKEGVGRVVVEAGADEGLYLLNSRRRLLVELEQAAGKALDVRVLPELAPGKGRIVEQAGAPEPVAPEEEDEEKVLSMYSVGDVKSLAETRKRRAEDQLPPPPVEVAPYEEEESEEAQGADEAEEAGGEAAASDAQGPAAQPGEGGQDGEGGHRKRRRRRSRGGKRRGGGEGVQGDASSGQAAPPLSPAGERSGEGAGPGDLEPRDVEADLRAALAQRGSTPEADQADEAAEPSEGGAEGEGEYRKRRRRRSRGKKRGGEGTPRETSGQAVATAARNLDEPPPIPPEFLNPGESFTIPPEAPARHTLPHDEGAPMAAEAPTDGEGEEKKKRRRPWWRKKG